MQIAYPFRRHAAEVAAFIRSLRLWVLALLAHVLGEGDRATRLWLRAELRAARSEVRTAVLCRTALLLWLPAGRAPPWRRPVNTRRGFRYAVRRTRMIRLVTRGLRLKTFADLRRALDDLDRLALRGVMLIRTKPRPRGGWRIVRARATPCADRATTTCIACDTS